MTMARKPVAERPTPVKSAAMAFLRFEDSLKMSRPPSPWVVLRKKSIQRYTVFFFADHSSAETASRNTLRYSFSTRWSSAW